MLIACDIGNTTVAVGVFNGRKLVRDWHIRSDRDKTCDEYGVILLNLLRMAGIETASVKSAIISSVVPPLTPIFQTLCRSMFGGRPLVVGPGLRTGMPILYDAPAEVGADRISAAVAAYEKYGGPCIVVDFGTATTFDAVSAKGEYLGGAIAPGILISAEALYLKTAKLPRIEIRKPAGIIGKTTVGSMQSGLYFGYVGLTQTIIAELRKELGEKAKVVATGGFGEQIAAEVPAIEAYEPNLVLEGLRIISERQKDRAAER
ncbi:MAG: type III pantothenate kinase [Candidatus Aminicenantes bacterium]|nr:type III pantothenate kinase [Candidatus Aminicenantes bacterium]